MMSSSFRSRFPVFLWLLGTTSLGVLAEPIRIEFLPPPMEGTLSVGVYDRKGKLVRTLHKEAEVETFRMALNGLVTEWDGKDDQGQELPAGSYSVRGYMVGDLGIEGVGFEGNEWMNEGDAPRVRRIVGIKAQSDRELLLHALVPGGEEPVAFLATPTDGDDQEADWRLAPVPASTPVPEPATPTSGEEETTPSAGPMRWIIEGNQLRQLSPDGEPVYAIASEEANDPPPTRLSLSPTGHSLFVLDENATQQRLWGLRFAHPAAPPAQADALFIKTIHFSETPEMAASFIKFPGGKVPGPILTVTPVANPLLGERKPAPIRLKVGTDPAGTYLATEDGLLLDYVSETSHLLWATLSKGKQKNAGAVFESDGAVVSEFRIGRLDQMMAFDAGTFAWKPSRSPRPKVSAEEEPTATPEAPASTPASSPETTPEPASQEAATPEAAQAPEPAESPETSNVPQASPDPE